MIITPMLPADQASKVLQCRNCLLPLSNAYGGVCGHQLCGHCTHQLMEQDGHYHHQVCAGTDIYPCNRAFLKCPYCNLPRRFYVLYALRADLEEMSPVYKRSLQDSPLRCAHTAVLKARLKYPNLMVKTTGGFSQLQAYNIVMAVAEAPNDDAFFQRIKNDVKLVGAWSVYRSATQIRVSDGGAFADLRLTVNLGHEFVVFTSPPEVVSRSIAKAKAAWMNLRDSVNPALMDPDNHDDLDDSDGDFADGHPQP